MAKQEKKSRKKNPDVPHFGDGNQNAKGNNGGRPRVYDKPEDMQKDIDAYFKECDDNMTEIYVKKIGKVIEISDPTPYTIEGLLLAVQFVERSSFFRYLEYDDGVFSHTIKKAKAIITRNKVEGGLSGRYNNVMTIFDLKNNAEYTDKIHTDITSLGKHINAKDMSDDEIQGKIDELTNEIKTETKKEKSK